jgi:hypothetical protein
MHVEPNESERTASASPRHPAPVNERGRRARSAVTSGRKLFPAGDPNSEWSRRFRDIYAGTCDDLGGVESLSFAEHLLAREHAALATEVEFMSARLSEGDKTVDVDKLGRTASHARRLKETLYSRQLRRQPRDVTPSLQEYIAANYGSGSAPTEAAAVAVDESTDAASWQDWPAQDATAEPPEPASDPVDSDADNHEPGTILTVCDGWAELQYLGALVDGRRKWCISRPGESPLEYGFGLAWARRRADALHAAGKLRAPRL